MGDAVLLVVVVVGVVDVEVPEETAVVAIVKTSPNGVFGSSS